MCGRYVIAQDVDAYARFFGVDDLRTEMLAANYNVAPTDTVYAIVDHEQQRLLGSFRWGLIPFWADTAKGGQINARAETVATKALFRDSFARRRCIIPVDGFFEWQKRETGGKVPHYLHGAAGSPLALAGLWASWHDPETEERLVTCTILTTTPNDFVKKIHDRMPVLLPPENWDRWLDREFEDVAALQQMLVSAPESVLDAYPVSTLVNNVRNNYPECITPLEGPAAESPV